MSKQGDVNAKGCQSKGKSKQRDDKSKGCQSKGTSEQRGVRAKGCQSNCHILRDVAHENFVFTSSTFTFRKVLYESFVFISSIPLFKGSLARNALLKVSGCPRCCVLLDKTCPRRWMGKLVQRTCPDGPGCKQALLNLTTL